MHFTEFVSRIQVLLLIEKRMISLIAPCFYQVPSGGKVYRPGQPKTRSRFSLRRLFYTNPLLSPPFTTTSSSSNTATASASSPARYR
jgi:hypothetical protein